MKKKTIHNLADTIFWYLLYFLPMIVYLVYFLSGSVTTIEFSEFFSNIGFEFASDNIIITSLNDLFGANGLMPLFNNTTPFIIFAWFVCTYLIHLVVDFLIFIPRLAHKWLNAFTRGDN